jgi:pimeloyl-ACP methyl ester carboxylesterase
VRQLLGYDKIDLYGLSNGATDVEAYAYRYPQHAHAIVIDSGSVVAATPPDFHDFFHIGDPQLLIDTMARECASIPACHATDTDPAATFVAQIQQLRVNPIPAQNAVTVPIDESSLVTLIESAEPEPLVTALDALRRGDPQLVRSLLTQVKPDNGSGQEFSAGAYAAQLCNDSVAPWLPTDSPDVRRQKLDSAVGALPDEAFSPFSKEAWLERNPPDYCLTWPAPIRYNPVVPVGMATIAVPTLLLSSDLNRDDLTSRSKLLLNTFSNATFVVVVHANNAAINRSGACIPDIVARFFETLDSGDTACAAKSAG